MKLNPTAILFWFFTSGTGYLISGTLYGAIAGATVGLGMSVVAELFF